MKIIKQEVLSKIAEAKQVFADTSWKLEKLIEKFLRGEEISELLEKYSEAFEARDKARARINELESLLK